MIFNWLKNFDVTKAVVLALVGIVSSWYDVRGQVNLLKQEATIRWEKQDAKDKEQDEAVKSLKQDLKDGVSEIKEAIKDQKKK